MLILGTAEQAAQRLVQLVASDKMLRFIWRHLLVSPLFLELLLAFVITLHLGVSTVLLGREIAVQMPSFFSSAVPMFLQVLGLISAKDRPNLLQPGWGT